MQSIEQHNREIRRNLESWRRKPLLREIYNDFHRSIAACLPELANRSVVELGSGVADIRETIPGCIRTDLFANPWIDRVENAYALSFADNSCGAVILFDVFHHLRYPGTALRELRRVIGPGGRVIVFDPCPSLLGLVVYGLFHHEPLALGAPIAWEAPKDWKPADIDYYAAQSNAARVFLRGEFDVGSTGLRVLKTERFCSISYAASGGYSGPQLYPARALPLMRGLDRFCSRVPAMFATRLLVVLEK